MSLTREHILEIWDQNWKGGWGYAPWSRALEGLTAEQAAWKPQPDRHSIWAIALHLIFWREVMVRRTQGETVSDAEIKRRNYESPAASGRATASGGVTEDAWHDVRQQFESSQQQVRDAIAAAEKLDDFLHLTYHDTYHIGQIMYIRALQGLPPVV